MTVLLSPTGYPIVPPREAHKSNIKCADIESLTSFSINNVKKWPLINTYYEACYEPVIRHH